MSNGTQTAEDVDRRRDSGRLRSEAYRDRRRRGVLLVSVEVDRNDIAGLERLALLSVGERDPVNVGRAVARFLAATRPVAAVGDALWPEPRERTASPNKNGFFNEEA